MLESLASDFRRLKEIPRILSDGDLAGLIRKYKPRSQELLTDLIVALDQDNYPDIRGFRIAFVDYTRGLDIIRSSPIKKVKDLDTGFELDVKDDSEEIARVDSH